MEGKKQRRTQHWDELRKWELAELSEQLATSNQHLSEENACLRVGNNKLRAANQQLQLTVQTLGREKVSLLEDNQFLTELNRNIVYQNQHLTELVGQTAHRLRVPKRGALQWFLNWIQPKRTKKSTNGNSKGG